jgi:hypothetical protein
MDLKISIEIGVTPELRALAESLLGTRKAAPESVVVVKEVKQKAESKAAKQAEKEAPKQEAKPQPQPQPRQEEQSKAQPQPQKATYTEEDVREAMHKCRCRIEGEDYKDNPQGEGYTKWHKNLTAFFKNLSARLGYDRPSELPVELRKAFIDECADIIIGEDGLLRSTPF